MAAKKTAAKKTKKKSKVARAWHHRRLRFRSPEVRRWNLWVHDVDTLLHQMVRNPALNEMAPEALVARAEAFADALHAMQDKRRPPGMETEW